MNLSSDELANRLVKIEKLCGKKMPLTVKIQSSLCSLTGYLLSPVHIQHIPYIQNCILLCAPSEDLDQPAHLPSLRCQLEPALVVLTAPSNDLSNCTDT